MLSGFDFRFHRKGLGLTQEQLARLLGVSREYVNRCEGRAAVPKLMEYAIQGLSSSRVASDWGRLDVGQQTPGHG